MERAHSNLTIIEVRERGRFTEIFNARAPVTHWRTPDVIYFALLGDAVVGRLNFVYAGCIEMSNPLDTRIFRGMLKEADGRGI